MKYVITILVSLGPLSAGLVQAQFGEPSGWESFRSRLRPENVSPITQNFGWSATRRVPVGRLLEKSAVAFKERSSAVATRCTLRKH